MRAVKKKLAIAAVVSVFTLAAPAVNAATIIIPFGNSPVTPGTSGKFTDSFTFSVPTPGRISISMGSTYSGPLTNVNFRHNQVRINGTPLTAVSTGVIELLEILHHPVAAGIQTLNVQGSSQSLGSYSGTFTFAVPEPATWALMILGMGAVGYAMRRQRQSVRTVQAA